MKTFVDNVCRQVIERHLVRGLPNAFEPETVIMLGEDELRRIAAEPANNAERRKELQGLLESLNGSLEDLQK